VDHWRSGIQLCKYEYQLHDRLTNPLYSQNDGGQWYAMLTAGLSSGMNTQGSIIPTPSSSTPFAYAAEDDGNFVISSSSLQWTAAPLAPVLSQAAGGARAAATLFARVAYCKDGAIVGISKEASLAVLINNTLSIAAPGNPVPRSNAVVLSDTFTGINGTLLSAHAADSAFGSGNGVGNVWTRTITNNDFKLNGSGKILLTTASTAQAAYLHDAAPQQDGHTTQVDLDFSASTVNGDFGGIQVRARDGNNYYFVSCRGNGVVRLEKKVAAVVTTIHADTAITGKTGTLKVVATNISSTTTQIDVYWNNTLIFSQTDTAFPWKYGEKVGLSCGSAAAFTFANFSCNDGISSGNAAAAYDGWVPLVGTATNTAQCQVDPRTPLAFNVGWTEPTAGATHVATLITTNTNGTNWSAAYDGINIGATAILTGSMAFGTKGDVGGLLAYNTTYRFYPAVAVAAPYTMRMFGGAYPSTIDVPKNAQMMGDTFIAMANSGGMTAITPAASGGTGTGGGGGCPDEKHTIFAERSTVAGTRFKNKYWVFIRTEEGGIFKVTPRHPWTTKRGLIMAKDLNSETAAGPDYMWVKMRATGEKKWLRVISVEPRVEEGVAIHPVVGQEDKLYFCGAPESTCDAEGHNVKPS
jgi:hypothetical protein